MIKPKEIIGIGGIEGWSLADRRTWNLLLVNAWNDRLEDPTADFTIQLSELRGLHDSNDRVRQSLEKIQKTLVKATLPDGTSRTVQMLGGTDIKDSDRTEGVLKYDFHRKLVPLLRESEIYARMEVKVLSAFTSKYALALYEVISTKINLRKSSEEIDLDTVRLWLGVGDGKLSTWGNLLKIAITPAVKELNALSPYTVEIEPIRQGRKVVKVCVSWEKKQPFSPAEQAAAREVNRLKHGRKARLSGTVQTVAIELTPDQIQKGYDAAASICRIDKHSAYTDWKEMISTLPVSPSNPVGHFIDFCKKRAQELR
jgi:plasmid replication initiation protein